MLPIVDLRRMIEIPGETEAFIDDLAGKLAEAVRELGRRGAVVAVSGGVDSGVVAALCVRALGPERVICLRLPERDVGDSSSDLGLELAEMLGCATVEEPITGALEALGCYQQARRGDPQGLRGLRAELAPQARPLAGRRAG